MADEEIDATRRRRTLTLTDPKTGLEVRAVCTIYADTLGADWTLYLTNRGTQDTPAIEDLRALDITLPPGLDWSAVLHGITGSDCSVNDWVPVDEPLTPGRRAELTPVGGRPSLAGGPFWTLDWGNAGVVTAIGWSAQWTAAIARDEAGGVRMQAGTQFLHLKFRPGESIRSPRIMQLYWTGADLDEAHNLWRRTMLKHIVPQGDGRPITPPIVHLSTSFYELNDSTEANVLSHLEAVRDLGFGKFWLDAYWTRGGFPAGMGFAVWFEPERVDPGTELAREQPEWVISPGGDGSGLLNLDRNP